MGKFGGKTFLHEKATSEGQFSPTNSVTTPITYCFMVVSKLYPFSKSISQAIDRK